MRTVLIRLNSFKRIKLIRFCKLIFFTTTRYGIPRSILIQTTDQMHVVKKVNHHSRSDQHLSIIRSQMQHFTENEEKVALCNFPHEVSTISVGLQILPWELNFSLPFRRGCYYAHAIQQLISSIGIEHWGRFDQKLHARSPFIRKMTIYEQSKSNSRCFC